MPSKRKKKWGKKSEKRGEERRRIVKVKTAVSLLNPKIVEILLSAHARTSQADILHLDQKAIKCTTCKPGCGKFLLFIARQWPENHSTSFKTRFSAKSPGVNGLINNSSVEKAVSYLLLPVFQNKHYNLFALINFYLWTTKCFFQTYLDQFRFLGNCPPTPPWSQHFGLRKK